MDTCKSVFLKNRLAAHVLKNVAYQPPASVWMGLFSAGIIETDSEAIKTQKNGAVMAALRIGELSAANELPGSSNYVRQLVNFGAEPVNGRLLNTDEIRFPQFTSDVGLVTHWAVLDAQSGGNVLYFGPLELARLVYMGDTFHVRLETLAIEDG
ncbi:phage tail fiber protein [Maridesulfovibrio sp. FT414]|uniref:phage tail fiber protein n=1 Tax=Maridesulfovibrio sp. FT414 TaxID=2979469 RepID=UPI003D80820B